MQLNVVNKEIQVGVIRVNGLGSSSVLLVGDTEVVTCSSVFDTPPEAVIAGPLVPLASTTG